MKIKNHCKVDIKGLEMEKALEILNQQLRDETLWLDSHEEAIKELEEAQLTRREWYQKGYAEAMKHKTCKLCAYCEPFNSVCFNDKSPLCADFVNSEYGCIYWKRKDNA